ncbi:hypothetical protein CKO15_10620 [Halorhodospira abdelmalekii]|nr:hypothetical protein [Halorhodospira abdelmalekii]
MYAVIALQLALLAGVEAAQPLLTGAMLFAGVANALRLARWDGVHTWREPLLWSLHLSYAFMALGLILWAVALTGAFAVELGLHVLAIAPVCKQQGPAAMELTYQNAPQCVLVETLVTPSLIEFTEDLGMLLSYTQQGQGWALRFPSPLLPILQSTHTYPHQGSERRL